MQNQRSKTLTVPEAARMIGRSRMTVLTWLKTRKLPGVKMGRKWVVREDALTQKAIEDTLRGVQL